LLFPDKLNLSRMSGSQSQRWPVQIPQKSSCWGFLHDPSNRCTTQIQERPGSRSCTWSD